MAELTKEQIEKAVDVWTAYPSVDAAELLIAAAPFLQLTWDKPTTDEWKSIHNSSICLYGDGPLCKAVSAGIRQFLVMRNAALLPKPIDPRRAKVLEVMREQVFGCHVSPEEATDAVLAVLKEEV